MGQAGRRQHGLVQIRMPGLAGDRLDDRADQHVAGVAVGPLLSGREVRLLVREHRDQLGRAQVAPDRSVHVAGQVGVVGDAGGMVEQLVQRDRLRVRIVRQVLGERIVERGAALVDQLQQRGRRELLGHRADPHDVIGRQRHAELDAGASARAAVEDLLAARDQDGQARPVRIGHRLAHHALGIGGDLGRVRRRRGSGHAGERHAEQHECQREASGPPASSPA